MEDAKNTKAMNEILVILVEECSEVTHAVSKILRHGLYSYNPDEPSAPDNRQQLLKEMADVLAVMVMLEDECGLVVVESNVREAIAAKRKYMHFSGPEAERGTGRSTRAIIGASVQAFSEGQVVYYVCPERAMIEMYQLALKHTTGEGMAYSHRMVMKYGSGEVHFVSVAHRPHGLSPSALVIFDHAVLEKNKEAVTLWQQRAQAVSTLSDVEKS